MLLVLGTVRLPAENVAEAREAMRRMIEASRAEPGCLAYGYAEDVLLPGLIHVKESWQSREHLDRHFQTEHISRWRSAWRALGITDRNLRVYDVDEGEPI